jgi:hypothetical protein
VVELERRLDTFSDIGQQQVQECTVSVEGPSVQRGHQGGGADHAPLHGSGHEIDDLGPAARCCEVEDRVRADQARRLACGPR